jgi:hypothetical protein
MESSRNDLWLARFAHALGSGWAALDCAARLFLICAVGLPVLLVVALRAENPFVGIGQTVVVAVEILLAAAVLAALITAARKNRGIGWSIGGSLVLLAWDGSFLLPLFACPIWFVFSILKNTIERPGWRLALVRIAIPPLTLGLAFANDAFQLRIAESNASRVVAACEEFHAATGRFPKSLDELVPQYLPSVPPAKYCLMWGQFVYLNSGKPMLVWCVVPPYGRKIYDFEDRRWSYLD